MSGAVGNRQLGIRLASQFRGRPADAVGQAGDGDAECSSTYRPSSVGAAPVDVSVSSNRIEGSCRSSAAGLAQSTSPRGPDTGTSSHRPNGASSGPVTDRVTASTPEKSARSGGDDDIVAWKNGARHRLAGREPEHAHMGAVTLESIENGARHNPRHPPLTHERGQPGSERRQLVQACRAVTAREQMLLDPVHLIAIERDHAPNSRAVLRRESEPGMGASPASFAGRHARPKTLNRAVSDHPHVAFREPKLPADLASCFLRVERQQDDHALAIGEPGEAVSRDDRCRGWRHGAGAPTMDAGRKVSRSFSRRQSSRFQSFAIVRLTPRTNDAI